MLPGAITYGFQSDKLCDLAATTFQSLAPEDIHRLIETWLTENFPYKIQGETVKRLFQGFY